jgi:hypothetical protein
MASIPAKVKVNRQLPLTHTEKCPLIYFLYAEWPMEENCLLKSKRLIERPQKPLRSLNRVNGWAREGSQNQSLSSNGLKTVASTRPTYYPKLERVA